MSAARFVVGIDLGTTNSAVAFAEPRRSLEIDVFPIPQLVAEGETAFRRTLPSAVYLAGEHDVPPGALALPWAEDRRFAVGELARKLGARVGGRLVTSAKSWLCHAGVDRSAAILPWGASDEVRRISPVRASALVLEHVRDTWDAANPDAPLAEQDVVLTVPASFDEVARELTAAAAEAAGLRVRLLEEPQAAVYAWIASRREWRDDLAGREHLLVVDVGGGTTDFSAVAVKRGAEGLALERIAVGEHILLGGDNVDLALAHRLTAALRGGGLDAARWQQLTALCRDAKERLLGEDPPAQVEISLAGRGRGVIRDTVRATLTREDALAIALDGFFPQVEADASIRSEGGQGLQEFGLPFATEPEVTRHLAAFVRRFDLRVDAVLFNGGALKPRSVRERIVESLAAWRGAEPAELGGSDLEVAVARGAVAYGLARRGRLLRISGGAARAFYVGLAEPERDGSSQRVLCVAPRGMEEGESVDIAEPVFEVTANAPVRFPIYASATRTGDAAGNLVEVDPASLAPLPPISTILRFGRKLEERRVPVSLRTTLTETGTLELWCLSRETDHRWRLRFELRGLAADEGDGADRASPVAAQELVVLPERIAEARARIEECFAGRSGDPVTLTRSLEEALGAGRDAWPIACIRALWDALFEREAERSRTPSHEARWLNLAGFLLRPGFGEERDAWRMERLWRLLERGPMAPNAAQVRAEWWTLWKRIAGGLERQKQQALFQEIRPVLLPSGGRRKAKPTRWKAGPQELREMWQVAGSLEHLPAATKAEAAAALVPRVASGKASEAEVWALGRLAARSLVHGPANAVIATGTVSPWIEKILGSEWQRSGAVALAVAQMARRTGDRARDVDEALRDRVVARLESAEESRSLARWVREVTEIDAREQALVMAESLPAGLRIASEDNRVES
jgi:molecular chaperone DnaK (HSP70)